MVESDSRKPSGGTNLGAAAERIRTTAQWMVVSYGAVAGVLVAGLQLTNLNETSGDARTLAIAGYGLAIAGVLVAILAAAVTLTAGRRSLYDLEGTGGKLSLRTHLNKIRDLRGGFSSIGELVEKTNQAIEERTTAWLAWQEDRTSQTKKAALDEAKAQANVVVPIADRLLEFASFEHLRRTWVVCRVFVAVGAIAAAIGVAIFAANSATADDDDSAISATPVVGTATLTANGLAAHAAELGTTCRAKDVSVVVTAADDEAYSLVVVPTDANRCGPAEISLKRSEGSVKATDVVWLSASAGN